jgi:hypothetical protein
MVSTREEKSECNKIEIEDNEAEAGGYRNVLSVFSADDDPGEIVAIIT